MGLNRQVTEWKMTEEERQEYIKKNPIRPTKKEPYYYSDVEFRGPNYKRKSKKGAAGRETKEGE